MTDPLVIDTNVGVVANGTTGVSPRCELACVRLLRQIKESGHLVIDDRHLIVSEYRKYLSASGQPGTGDEFMRWVHDNQFNDTLCTRVSITTTGDGSFEEFPPSAALSTFHKNDRMFVCVAIEHPGNPEICVALDRGWPEYQAALANEGIRLRILCPDDISAR